MKKIIFLFTLVIFSLFTGLFVTAQNSDWLWARKAGGSSDEGGLSVTTDKEGNVVVAGDYNSPSLTFGNYTLSNQGGYDLFTVKYNEAGDVLWAMSAGGPSDEKGESVCADTAGNIYMTGTYSSPQVTFGNITLNNFDSTDIFTVKYDSGGNVLWAKRAGGSRQDYAQSIDVDVDGNSYIAGYFNSSSIIFDDFTISNSHTGYYDIFLVKYNTDGNVTWVQSADGYFSDRASSVSVDDSGNLFLAGYFYSSTMFFGSDTIFNAGKYNFFLTRYNNQGNVTWAVSGGGSEDDRALGTAVDKEGNVYVTGQFTSPSLNLGNYTLTNTDSSDIFLVRYDTDGNVDWAESAGGADHDAAVGITTGNDGSSVYLTGYFKSPSIAFGNNILNNTSAGSADIFIARYDSSGNALLAMKADGVSSDYSEDISSDDAGNIFLTGRFYSTPLTFGSYSLYRTGQDDMFLAKFGITTDGIRDAGEMLNSSVYPNPLKGSAKIMYDLDGKDLVIIKVYDITGVLRFVHDDGLQMHGPHEAVVDLSSLSSGIYIYRIIAGSQSGSGKIIMDN